MEQTPALGTRIIPKSHTGVQPSKPPCMLHSLLDLTSFIPNKSLHFRFPQQQAAINSVWPSLGCPNTPIKCHCHLPVTPLLKSSCMAHWTVPRRCLFQTWIGTCFLLSRSLCNLEAVQLHQVPLSNQSTKAVFRWEFYFGLCKMCRHKVLQKTRSFIPGLSEFFPCSHFPGAPLKLWHMFSAAEKPSTTSHKSKDLVTFFFFFIAKGEPLLWNPLQICGSRLLVFFV